MKDDDPNPTSGIEVSRNLFAPHGKSSAVAACERAGGIRGMSVVAEQHLRAESSGCFEFPALIVGRVQAVMDEEVNRSQRRQDVLTRATGWLPAPAEAVRHEPTCSELRIDRDQVSGAIPFECSENGRGSEPVVRSGLDDPRGAKSANNRIPPGATAERCPALACRSPTKSPAKVGHEVNVLVEFGHVASSPEQTLEPRREFIAIRDLVGEVLHLRVEEKVGNMSVDRGVVLTNDLCLPNPTQAIDTRLLDQTPYHRLTWTMA